MPYPLSLADLIDVPVACDPRRTALIDRDGAWSYESLNRRANQLANALIAAGVTSGQRVAVLIGNENRFIEALLGIWRAGAIAVLPNTRLTAEQIAGQTISAQVSVVLASEEQVATTEVIAAHGGTVRILLGAGYDAWRDAYPDARPGTDVVSESICMQPYTTGSTGAPKGVLLTHRGQLHNARTVAQIDMIAEDDRALVSAPIFHANAMAAAVLPFLVVGGSIVILPKFDTEQVPEAVQRHRCTFMTGVPSMYSSLLNVRAFERHDMSSLRLLACGSAPVTLDLLQRLEVALPGITVTEGYGLTEGGPVVTKNPRFGLRRLGSIGVPLPGVDVRLIGGHGESVTVGEVGEIMVRGPGVAVGYHHNDAAFAARVSPDGWLRTGDLAHADSDGYLYFRGRMDDMINVAGENVYPQSVEAVIRRHPSVAEVAVVAAAHESKGQVPIAFVVLKSGMQLDPEEIRQFCLSNGPAFAHPRRVLILDQLPVGPTGKVDRRALTDSPPPRTAVVS